MNHSRILFHMVRADFLERTRRTSFFVVLGFAVYLGYLIFAGDVSLQLGPYRGVANAAWLGSVVALVGSVFLSLIGFYAVKNTIQRDRETRVGRILAATPMSRPFYTLSKALSNWAVLAAMVLVLAAAAVLIQWTQQGWASLNLFALLTPLLVFGLTAVSIASALAVLFETLPGLRGGGGNIAYFFLWCFLLSMSIGSLAAHAPFSTINSLRDLSGIATISGQMQALVRSFDPAYQGGSSFSVGGFHPAQQTFLWPGLQWTTTIFLSRLLWLAVALALTMLAAVFFDRFDPAGESRFLKRNKSHDSPTEPTTNLSSRPEAAHFAAVAERPAALPALPQPLAPSSHQATAATLTRTQVHTRITALILAELRLLLRGQRWWWYTIAAGLFLACLFSPLDVARNLILVAWIWPALLWAQLGSRESQFHTQALIFPAPNAFPRQLLSSWAAGVLLAALTGGGLALHLLLARDFPALAAWAVATLFIPALALALGVISQSRKPFEALYTVLWYIGPLHHIPRADFMATTAASSTPLFYLIATAILLTAACLWRKLLLARA